MKLMKPTSVLGTLLIAIMALSVGCGKKNESGKNSAFNPYYNQLGTFPGSVGSIPTNITNPYAQQIFQFLPCLNGQQRVGIQFGLNMSVAVNATYVGITSEGDVAIVSSSGNSQAVFSAYVCYRPEFGQGTLSQPQQPANPAVGRSLAGCLVDEISAARLLLPTMYGYALTLNFRPIHFGVPGYPQFSQALVQMGCRSF